METKKWVIVSSQISLIIINLIILAFGAVGIGIGLWVATSDRDYLRITEDNTNYGGIGALLAFVGFFILAVAVVGFVGIFCGKRMCGRITIVVYAFIVGIVIIIVLAGAIAGYVERDQLEDTFREDAEKTLQETPGREDYRQAWDDAQREVKCCGVDSYRDWANITWFNATTENAVPVSCCAEVGGCGNITYLEIAAGGGIVNNTKVWNQGCVDAIIDEVSGQIGAVAGVCIAIGIVMIAAMVMACILGICNKPERYEVV